MNSFKSKLKVLLLQIRETVHVRKEEHETFARYSGLRPDQIDLLNLFTHHKLQFDDAVNYDAVFIGGASKASVLESDVYPFVLDAQNFLLQCIDHNMPVFASCFGFQLAVRALGGDIIRDESGYEMGSIIINRVEDMKDDPIFKDIPGNFHAISVHQERAMTEPDNCQLLAYTDNCCHAFRVNGKPFWAFQFHPEVDKKTLIQRLTVYKKKYTSDDNQLNNVIKSAKETPVSNSLPEKFIQYVVDQKSLKN